MKSRTGTSISTLLALLSSTSLLLYPHLAAADHGHQVPMSDPTDDWATRHMAEEHHISNLDPPSFFTLHDFNSDGQWSPSEIRRTYGLDDRDSKELRALFGEGTAGEDKRTEKGKEIVNGVLATFDKNGDGLVSREEFVEGWRTEGKRLGDYGTGPGHHGDDEYEYEIHHFERFHDENTKEEDLTHPEDIEHFRKHDEMEAAAERQEQLDRMLIVEANIPSKYRRN